MAKKSFGAGITKTGVLNNSGGDKIKEVQAKAQYNFQYISLRCTPEPEYKKIMFSLIYCHLS